jgi:quinol monooxygenase YgiN
MSVQMDQLTGVHVMVKRREFHGLVAALIAASTNSVSPASADVIKKETGMNEIKGIARVKFHPGKLEEWKRLTAEAIEIVRTKDSGTLQYEIFFNEDESEAIVFERYKDAVSALEHFANISHLMEPLMGTASVTGEVLGTPNTGMREALKKGGPKLYMPWMTM